MTAIPPVPIVGGALDGKDWPGVTVPATFVHTISGQAYALEDDLRYIRDDANDVDPDPPVVLVERTIAVMEVMALTCYVGVPFSFQLNAEASDGTDQSPYTWKLQEGQGDLPVGVTLSEDGVLAGTLSALDSHDFAVQVTDKNGAKSLPFPSNSGSIELSCVASPVIITTTLLPDAVVGVAYSEQLAVTGGYGPYTWALAGGSDPLPTGLTLSSGGLVAGTPTDDGEIGTIEITVVATDDSDIASADTAVAFDYVAAPVDPVVITTTLLPDAMYGVAYSAQLAATGGTGPYTWAAVDSLPSGLALAANGLLSGTPDNGGDIGNHEFTVVATDDNEIDSAETGVIFNLVDLAQTSRAVMMTAQAVTQAGGAVTSAAQHVDSPATGAYIVAVGCKWTTGTVTPASVQYEVLASATEGGSYSVIGTSFVISDSHDGDDGLVYLLSDTGVFGDDTTAIGYVRPGPWFKLRTTASGVGSDVVVDATLSVTAIRTQTSAG